MEIPKLVKGIIITDPFRPDFAVFKIYMPIKSWHYSFI